MVSRSAITLRMEAGDKACGSRWDKVRDPTGSPLAKKASTRWRKTSRGRSVKPCGLTKGVRGAKVKLLKFLIFPVPVARRARDPIGNAPRLAPPIYEAPCALQLAPLTRCAPF